MPIPQVNDRIKEAPVVVLRAVFAGIGQILLTADKVRARAAEQVLTQDRAPARAPVGLPADRRAPEPPRNGTTRTEPAVAGRSAVREVPPKQGPVTTPVTKTKATPATKATSTAKATSPAKTTPATKASRPAKATSTGKPTSTGTPAPAAKTAAKAAPAAKTTRAAKTTPAKAPRTTKAAKAVPAPRAAKEEPVTQAPPLPGYDDLSLASLRARLRVLDAATIQAVLTYEKANARREPVITMLERRLAKISAG